MIFLFTTTTITTELSTKTTNGTTKVIQNYDESDIYFASSLFSVSLSTSIGSDSLFVSFDDDEPPSFSFDDDDDCADGSDFDSGTTLGLGLGLFIIGLELLNNAFLFTSILSAVRIGSTDAFRSPCLEIISYNQSSERRISLRN